MRRGWELLSLRVKDNLCGSIREGLLQMDIHHGMLQFQLM